MFRNYKTGKWQWQTTTPTLPTNRAPIHVLHRQEMLILDSCLDVNARLFPLWLLACVFLLAHSLVLFFLPSVLPALLTLYFTMECASQQYLMKVWLTGRSHAWVFMLHVASQNKAEYGRFLKQGGKKTGRHIPIAEATNANSRWLRKTGLSQFWTAAGWITTQHVHTPGLIKSCKNKAAEVNIRTVQTLYLTPDTGSDLKSTTYMYSNFWCWAVSKWSVFCGKNSNFGYTK